MMHNADSIARLKRAIVRTIGMAYEFGRSGMIEWAVVEWGKVAKLRAILAEWESE